MSPWHVSREDDRHAVKREVLARLGDRWSVAVIHMIESESIRFTVLQRKIGATGSSSAKSFPSSRPGWNIGSPDSADVSSDWPTGSPNG